MTLLIEARDGLTGALESAGEIETFRAVNAEDQETLDALDRLEKGESESELVGFSRLVAVRLSEVLP